VLFLVDVVDLEGEFPLLHGRSFRATVDAEDDVVPVHGVVDGHGERLSVFVLVYESPDVCGSEQPEALVACEVYELTLCHSVHGAILVGDHGGPPRPKVPSWSRNKPAGQSHPPEWLR
jgi:hypothetical protein